MSGFKYEKLAEHLKEQMAEGVWGVNQRLPSIRVLSEHYDVSKITVQQALRLLEIKGLVEARERSGYYTRQPKHLTSALSKPAAKEKPKLVKMPAIFQDIMEKSAAFDICPGASATNYSNYLLQLNRQISRAFRYRPIAKAVYYNEPQGFFPLREQVSKLYANRVCDLDPKELCITAGCQNSLFIALMSVCEPGDTVAVESPAFYGVLQLLQQLKLKVLEIPASPQNGISVSDLENALQKWPLKACVVTPNFATPTGSCIPKAARQRLIDVANRYSLPLIEDDIYGELGFHSRPSPLKALDTQGNVVLCGSLSKSLSRDLRVGWISGGKHHEKIVHLKLVNQLASCQAIQEGVAGFIEKGYYRRHLSHFRQELLKQRNQLVNVINKSWGFNYKYTMPDGGLSIWVETDKSKDIASYYHELKKEKIFLTPGALFTTTTKFNNFMRLSFAHPITQDREFAIRRVGVLLNG